ncbi:hypothetical protein H072_5196 [Dactylellina haptotyla CBS 200.50]|uniref:Glycosyl hydrolase family 88 n=1 Tax=Dactylellina haptotyla (strain CBS 200.50) TaxID=1284197 RepID=S8AD37_DACHA|nr:hypothetical protein H072_5196 [Dactylellina haptotyla CBS 200.50]
MPMSGPPSPPEKPGCSSDSLAPLPWWKSRVKLWFLLGTVALILILVVALVLCFVVFRPSPPPSIDCPTNISASIQHVNDYWQKLYPILIPGPESLTWGLSTYYSGNLAAYNATGIERYYTYALNWATSNNFSLALPNPPRDTADYLGVGYDYIILYHLDPNHPDHYIQATDNAIRKIIASPRNDLWSWVDALSMAMPHFAHLGVIRNDTRYFDKMYALYNHTKSAEGGSGLWDPSKGLWWRDKHFIGTDIYWSRGNGWAIAALAKVLDVLPRWDAHYDEYVSTMRQMGSALADAQQANGFWYVDLGNSTDFPGPETSGTMLFVYGIAWGINHGIFDEATYRPIVAKAWNSVVNSAIAPDGRLMYVQGPGFAPASRQPVTLSSTFDYGLGAFLLGGSELVQLCPY